MKLLKVLLSNFYLLWVFLVFTLSMILLLPFIILPVLIHVRIGIITLYALKVWSFVFSYLSFIRYRIIDKHHAARSKPYIYTCNHTSFLDLPGISLAIPGQFRPLAKKELLKIPLLGIIIRVVTVVVDRSSIESRKTSLKALKATLKKNVSIVIFPEGTQNRTEKLLQPFYKGAFRMAVETHTPIMPLVVIGAGKLMPPGRLYIRPGKIKVVFGKEIPTEGYTLSNIHKLKDEVFDQMQTLIHNHLPSC